MSLITYRVYINRCLCRLNKLSMGILYSILVHESGSGPERKRQKHWLPAVRLIKIFPALDFVKCLWCSGYKRNIDFVIL